MSGTWAALADKLLQTGLILLGGGGGQNPHLPPGAADPTLKLAMGSRSCFRDTSSGHRSDHCVMFFILLDCSSWVNALGSSMLLLAFVLQSECSAWAARMCCCCSAAAAAVVVVVVVAAAAVGSTVLLFSLFLLLLLLWLLLLLLRALGTPILWLLFLLLLQCACSVVVLLLLLINCSAFGTYL